MYKKELNIGEKFGEWTVIRELDERKNGYLVYWVKCSCGTETQLSGWYLRTLKSKYCRSCSAKKRFKKGKMCKAYRHGAAIRTDELRPTYNIWLMMRQRCLNPKSRDYKNYGERGINICEKWNNFEGFLEDMGPRPKNLSLERIDNNGNYSKENCKWATRFEQNNNRRDNTFFMINGSRVTRTQIQNKMNWTRDMYRRRFEKYGQQWIINQYLSTKP